MLPGHFLHDWKSGDGLLVKVKVMGASVALGPLSIRLRTFWSSDLTRLQASHLTRFALLLCNIFNHVAELTLQLGLSDHDILQIPSAASTSAESIYERLARSVFEPKRGLQ